MLAHITPLFYLLKGDSALDPKFFPLNPKH